MVKALVLGALSRWYRDGESLREEVEKGKKDIRQIKKKRNGRGAFDVSHHVKIYLFG